MANTPRVTVKFGKPKKEARTPEIPMVSAWSVVGRSTGYDGKPALVECVTIRTYFNPRGNGMNPVRACVWVRAPRGSGEEWLSGSGSAGGCGFHKESAAIADAINNAGIMLFGDPYMRDASRNKTPLHFGGTGDSHYEAIFFAIAKARGFRGPFVLVRH